MIELKILCDSAHDVMKELAALAAGLTSGNDAAPTADMLRAAQAQAVNFEMQAQAAEDKPRRGRKPKAEVAEEATQEADAGEQTIGAGAASAQQADATEAAPATAAEASGANEPTTPPASASDGKVLDFDEEVAPVVLGYVREKGKPWVVDILTQFGVARASELDPSQYGELVDALNAAAEG